MPATFAHPAAVLPLAGTPLPFAALVAGSMAPDLPLFVPAMTSAGLGYGVTHAPLGMATLDVAVGCALWALWRFVLTAPLADAAPAALRRRLPPAPRVAASLLVTVPVAVGIGVLTHVGWDEFTHVGRWGMRHIGWLAEAHGPWLGVKWAQYGSGVGGLLVLAVAATVCLGRRPVSPAAPRRRPRLAPWVVFGPVVVAGGVAGWRALCGGAVHDILYDSVTGGGAAAAVTLLVLALAWRRV